MSREIFDEPNEDEIEIEADPVITSINTAADPKGPMEKKRGDDGAYQRPPHPSHPVTRGIVQVVFLALWAGIIAGMMLLELKLSEYEMLALGGALTKLTEIAWSIARFHFGASGQEGG